MKTKNIVFDFGGVLLTEGDAWLLSKETKDLLNIIDDKKLTTGWNAAWPDGRDGKTSEDQFFQTFLNRVVGKVDTRLVISLKKIYREKTNTFTAFQILKSLKNKYKLFAIPNITKDWLEYKIQRFGLNNYIDFIVSSCGEGIAKPNKKIFLNFVNKTNIEPSETLFVDNTEKNIDSAKELGFNTHLYTDLESLKSKFDKLGITL